MFGKVWPSKTSPAPGGEQATPGPGSTTLPMSNKTMLMGAGVVLVALLAVISGRKDKGTTEDDEGTGFTTATYDGTATDVTSAIDDMTGTMSGLLDTLGSQVSGSITSVSDNVDDLTTVITDRLPISEPAEPAAPTPAPAAPKPKPAKSGPKVYTVKAGDTLNSIAKAHKTTAAKLYARNKVAIQNAAQAHKDKKWKTTKKVYRGTTLVIPAK